jgi:N-acetylneuraminic acid mutarotase/glucose/arabinose dehydrogenase
MRSVLALAASSLVSILLVSILLGSAFAQQTKPSGFSSSASQPRGATVQFDPSAIAVTPSTLTFGAVQAGDQQSLALTIRNSGFVPLHIGRLQFLLGASGNSQAFTLQLNGKSYRGSTTDVARTISPTITLARGQEVTGTLEFAPTEEQLDAFVLRIESQTKAAEVQVSGLGGHAGDPFLHVTIDGPRWRVDYDGDGSEALVLDGGGSHTHEPGHTLAAFTWRVDGIVASTTSALSTPLDQPTTGIELEITDDNVPPRSLSGNVDVRLVEPDEVPGVLATYHDASASGAGALLDSELPAADFVEQRNGMSVNGAGSVGSSPFTQDVLVRLVGQVDLEEFGTYTFTTTGGAGSRIFVDGALVTEPVFLLAGQHDLEARFAVDTLANLPLAVNMALEGVGGAIDESLLTHDETGVVPVIHSMTSSGAIAGGTPISILGFGFFPSQQVVVHWGDQDLIEADFTSISPGEIRFTSPPGGGAIAVSVETANGASNVRTFTYLLFGPPPIQFRRDLIVDVPPPTAGTWAPDGKLYVTAVDGRITALEFDEDYELLSQATFPGVSGLTNKNALSIAVNPYDPPSPVKLYVGHGKHFVNGGSTPTGPSPYTGQISVLTGPNFDTPVPLVTGLPTSNHDHAINGIAFDDNGDLLISVGSMTNAGIKDPDSGDLPESPLSAGIVKARLSDPSFDGAITYVETVGGAPNDDQRFGDLVDVAGGVDVELHASGLRNAFGLVYTTKGRLYATDNGPNIGFGQASLTQSTQGPDPYDDDELNLVEWGNYYGSPNRNRGRIELRQNTYYAGLHGPPSIPETLFQMVSWLPPSCDGVDEYRAATFNGQIRGQLIVQEYQNKLRRVLLKPDGRGTFGQAVIEPNTLGLGCLTGPGGAILSLDYGSAELEILEADDLASSELLVYDVFPWRAPASGGAPFVIGGRGFGTLGTTAVTIGGHAATLTAVTWGRIRGLVPAEASPTPQLLDVVVTVGENQVTLPQAFRYLLGPGNEPGRWEALANISTPLGEVAAGAINGVMYLVGEGSSTTFAYDLQNRQWLAPKSARPYTGHHHAAEVVGGKLYLVGGLDGGSEGRVQIFDPATNTWTTGADMPWSGGSVSTAVIDGEIYAAGGIVSTFTVANCAVYDPVADTWTTRAAMPDSGRNHTAAGTDGTKLYVFGGRRAGNFVTNGYDSLMIYDPGTDAWSWSGEVGSTLAPLPEARGGMGKAVWLRGEFYVFGGETLDDPDADANGVYARVDVYRPSTNTWRSERAMPNPRHGVFPVLYQGHVFLAGGGTQTGNAQSTLFDTFTRQ